MRPPYVNAWTSEQEEILRTMRAAGFGFHAIALATGHSISACCTKASALGVYKPKPAKPAPPHDIPRIGCAPKETASENYSAPAADVKGRGRILPCLNCRKSFRSEGPHNRLCSHCRGIGLIPLDVPARVGR